VQWDGRNIHSKTSYICDLNYYFEEAPVKLLLFPCVLELCANAVHASRRSIHLVNGNATLVAEPKSGSIV
jgi:hypothetical protein